MRTGPDRYISNLKELCIAWLPVRPPASVGVLREEVDRQPKHVWLGYQSFVDAGDGISLWDELIRGALLGNDEFAKQVNTPPASRGIQRRIRVKPLFYAAVRSKEIPRVERMLPKPTP